MKKRAILHLLKCTAVVLNIVILAGCFASCNADVGGKDIGESDTDGYGENTSDTSAQTQGDEIKPTDGNGLQKPEVKPATPSDEKKITVACIGDSITEGIGVDAQDRGKYSYPARLAEALGDGYTVLNYGKSGATMCSTSAELYSSKNWFKFSGKYEDLKKRTSEIDVAFIMLGTNDGNFANANINESVTDSVSAFKTDYEANLTKLVTDLRNGNGDVKIYLMTSPKCFRSGNNWEQILTEIVRPLQRELAQKLSLEIYDMYEFSSNTMKNINFPDNLHPGKNGYYLMGQEIAKVVAALYGTQVLKGEAPVSSVNYSESFTSVSNGTAFTNQNNATVNVGDGKWRVKVLEDSSLSVNDGVLRFTRNTATSDAFFDVLLPENLVSGVFTFEMSVKAGDGFNSRGAMFFMFGYHFLRYTTAGDITNNAGTKIGELRTDRFIKIAVTVYCTNGVDKNNAYKIYIDGQEVYSGSFELTVGTAYFRPIQFFGSGNSTFYVDGIKAYNVKE